MLPASRASRLLLPAHLRAGAATSARLGRRSFHLLPSQALSLLSAHIDAVPAPILARSPADIAQVNGSASSIALTADVHDAHPARGLFVQKVESSASNQPAHYQSLALQGTRHVASNVNDAEKIAASLLREDSHFRSGVPPFNLKRADKVIVNSASTPSTGERSEKQRLQILLLADRQPHPHPHNEGQLHFGPTLSISTLPSSVPIAQARRSLPERVSTTCIDVGRLLPMGTLDSGDGSGAKPSSPESVEALRSTAERAAKEAVAQAQQHSILPSSAAGESNSAELLTKVLQQLFQLYWISDGERFVLELALDGASGTAEVVQQSLTFDDYTAGKAGRQKLLNAMRTDGSLLFEPGMSVPASPPAGSSISALTHELSALEAEAESEGLIYRTHQNGSIALFGYGAGMGMGTLDGVIAAGGAPSNFFDGGGGATRENAKAAMRVISKDPSVRCVLVNIFGGITKSDLVALGIVDAFEEFGLRRRGVPLIARFKGNKAAEANETLGQSKLNVTLVNSLREGAEEAIKALAKLDAAAAKKGKSAAKAKSAPKGARAMSTLVRRPAAAQSIGVGRRAFGTSSIAQSRQPFTFVTGYAFAGKPRDEPEQAQGQSQGATSAPQQIGFLPGTAIGKWRDELLQGGEAGEDALACASMASGTSGEGEEGDVVIAVADGVGGWTENGVDPSLFS